jgi:hypothetical protein
MIWKNIRWFLILAILIVIIYLFFMNFFKKREGADTNNSVSKDISNLDDNGVLPNFPITNAPTILKFKELGYDIAALGTQYNDICNEIKKSISTYNEAVRNRENRTTNFLYDFAISFVRSDSDFRINFDRSSINAGFLSSPSNLSSTNPFKAQFGGVTSESDSTIIASKNSTVNFVENSTDITIDKFSQFGLLYYYYVKLWIVTEWYMWYSNASTVSVSSVKGANTGSEIQAALTAREAALAAAQTEQQSLESRHRDAYDKSCGNKDLCPDSYNDEKKKVSQRDNGRSRINGLVEGNKSGTGQYDAISIAGLKTKLAESGTADIASTKKAQDDAQSAYQMYRAKVLTTLTGLIPDILKDITKNVAVIQNINIGLQKLTASYIASCEAKSNRITLLTTLKTANYPTIENIIKTTVPKFFDQASNFDTTQIEDYTGNIADNIDKLNILKTFNSAYDVKTGNSSVNALIQSILKNVSTNVEYLNNDYVKSARWNRVMDKYTLTFENCNAVNYITDVYYRDIKFLSDTVYGYIITTILKKTDSVESLPLCKVAKTNAADSPASSSDSEMCTKSEIFDNLYKYMISVERFLFDANGTLKDINSLTEPDLNKISDYGSICINRLLNIRNLIFMLYIRSAMMLKYVSDNLIYTNVNTNEMPIDGALYQVADFISLFKTTPLFTDSKTQYEIERFILYLSEISLQKIYLDLYDQYTQRYAVNPKKIINISQGQNIYNSALQYIAYAESCNKFTNNIENLYKLVYFSLSDATGYRMIGSTDTFNRSQYISADIKYCNANLKTSNNEDFLPVFEPSQYARSNAKITVNSATVDLPNATLVETCRAIRDKLKNYLYLPTYFSNGNLNGCYQDSGRNSVFTDKNSFLIGVVNKSTGSKKDPKQDRYGAIINCINDTVAYNNTNNSRYNTVTLKPYGTSSDAFYCYALEPSSNLLNSPTKETDVSKCYIDKSENVANTAITYKVNPLRFDPKTDKLIFRGCYATSDEPNGIYNTLPHQIGGDLSQFALFNKNDPTAAAKECQRLVTEQNDKYKKNYDIFGITSDPVDTNKLYCFAGNTKFDAAKATSAGLMRSDYTRGCNVEYPGPGNYMIFQDSSAALNDCKSASQIKLDKYTDLKTTWLNKNIKNQTDNLKMVAGMIDEIDKRFPIKFEISSTSLVGNGSSTAPKIEIDRKGSGPLANGPSASGPGSSDSTMNKVKLNIWLAKGLPGNQGDGGTQGDVGTQGKISDKGLPGYPGYHGST